jgi:hypothetical protein
MPDQSQPDRNSNRNSKHYHDDPTPPPTPGRDHRTQPRVERWVDDNRVTELPADRIR